MTEAFKCDRCGEFETGDGEVLSHIQSDLDDGYSKELCETCYLGWIEYITGGEAKSLNEMEHLQVNDD